MINNKFIADFLLSPRFKVYRHLVLLLIFTVISIDMVLNIPEANTTPSKLFLGWLAYTLLYLLAIYLNIYVLAPRFLLKNRLTTYFLSVFGVVFVAILLIIVIQSVLYKLSNEFIQIGYKAMLLSVLSSVILISLIISGASAILLLRHWIQNNQRIDALESTTLHSELKYLKNQINPHFLFNMLNNAHVLIKKNREEASQVLFKLEDLLRYQINDSSKEKVLLRSDIHFLNDFLNLEKIRRDNFEYSIRKEGEIDPVWIPPLLFIPFVENAVKHNPDSDHLSYIHLSFTIEGPQLVFKCENSKPNVVIQKKMTGGLGLKNIKRRLELLYPEHYSLNISDEQNTFTVDLKITL
ncbi:histidine kinase [Rapidithrix thailandica]|uniref:Histidine kinase n=1 Tax=Rapidithrix thailandica TaxID=413964 RepID=A0AAW9S7W6_9BACT